MQSLSQQQLETLRLMDVDVWQLRPDVGHSTVVDGSAEPNNKPDLAAGSVSAGRTISDKEAHSREAAIEWPREAGQWCATLERTGENDWVFVCQFASEKVHRSSTINRLFDALLFSLGLDRQEAAIISTWPSLGDAAAETTCLETLLCDYCAKYQPKIAVVLGRECASALLGSNEETGSLHHHLCFGEESLPLVRTHGLDVLIAQPERKADTWQALTLARQIVER